jgi:succinyl-CoA synthetase beta subunit
LGVTGRNGEAMRLRQAQERSLIAWIGMWILRGRTATSSGTGRSIVEEIAAPVVVKAQILGPGQV